jgi:hypothetical protein
MRIRSVFSGDGAGVGGILRRSARKGPAVRHARIRRFPGKRHRGAWRDVADAVVSPPASPPRGQPRIWSNRIPARGYPGASRSPDPFERSWSWVLRNTPQYYMGDRSSNWIPKRPRSNTTFPVAASSASQPLQPPADTFRSLKDRPKRDSDCLDPAPLLSRGRGPPLASSPPPGNSA